MWGTDTSDNFDTGSFNFLLIQKKDQDLILKTLISKCSVLQILMLELFFHLIFKRHFPKPFVIIFHANLLQ